MVVTMPAYLQAETNNYIQIHMIIYLNCFYNYIDNHLHYDYIYIYTSKCELYVSPRLKWSKNCKSNSWDPLLEYIEVNLMMLSSYFSLLCYRDPLKLAKAIVF